MPAAAILALGSVASAGIGYMGAKAASGAQARAAQNALNFQKQVYGENVGRLSPYIDMGKNAFSSLADLYGFGSKGAGGISEAFSNFTNLPAYQFPFQQGMLALTRNLNAQGKQMSGARMRQAQEFGQGLASTYMMNNYVNPLYQFANLGQTAGSSLAGVSTNAAGQIGNTMQGVGQAQAAGTVGGTNAITGGINNLSGNLALYSMLGQNPSSYAGGNNMIQATNPNGGGLSPMFT